MDVDKHGEETIQRESGRIKTLHHFFKLHMILIDSVIHRLEALRNTLDPLTELK